PRRGARVRGRLDLHLVPIFMRAGLVLLLRAGRAADSLQMQPAARRCPCAGAVIGDLAMAGRHSKAAVSSDSGAGQGETPTKTTPVTLQCADSCNFCGWIRAEYGGEGEAGSDARTVETSCCCDW